MRSTKPAPTESIHSCLLYSSCFVYHHREISCAIETAKWSRWQKKWKTELAQMSAVPFPRESSPQTVVGERRLLSASLYQIMQCREGFSQISISTKGSFDF